MGLQRKGVRNMSNIEQPDRVTLCEWHEGYEYDNCPPCEAEWEAWADIQVDRAIEERHERGY